MVLRFILRCIVVSQRGCVWAVLMLAMSVSVLSDSKKCQLLRVMMCLCAELFVCAVS